MKYNSIQSHFSVIDNTDVTTTLNLNTSKTLSVYHNFLPINFTNNYEEDGYQTPELLNISNTGKYDTLAPIKRVSFLKGGVLSPVENEIDVTTASNSGRPKSELLINYIDSIKPYSMFNHSLISPQTEVQLYTDVNNMTGADKFASATTIGVQGPDQSNVFG